jgi:hypothetical protein
MGNVKNSEFDANFTWKISTKFTHESYEQKTSIISYKTEKNLNFVIINCWIITLVGDPFETFSTDLNRHLILGF